MDRPTGDARLPQPDRTWTSDSDLLASAGPDRLQQELVQAQKMEALGQLVSGVAHELNNPLAAIVAFSQLIRQDPRLPDDLRHDADLLVQEADRTRRIVQNLLDFARQRPPERHPTALAALVHSVLDLQSYLITSSDVEVDLDIPESIPPIALDRAQMQQVLLNLTLNAIQAIRSRGGGGHLSIRAVASPSVKRPRVRMSITDDGPGVAPEHRDRLFVPFFTTKPPGEGTGLGLPVSFGIVAAHGGGLRFEPNAAGGATFIIELPVTPGIDPAADAPTAAEPRPGDLSDRQRPAGEPDDDREAARPRVLVVDDESSIRRFLAKALANAGYEAVLAETGDEAVELVRDGPFSAALCDHRMAGMSGTDVYDAVVGLRPELGARFIFMSGDVLNPALRSFAETRGLGLLAKPFDVDSVGRAVRAVVTPDAAAQRPE